MEIGRVYAAFYIERNFYLFYSDCMCGKTFDRYARCTASREEYMELANQRHLRRMLTGSTKFPKYPDMQYRPLCRLYGLQNMGKLYANCICSNVIFLEIHFTCEHEIRLSPRQWQLLSAVSFGVYATGQVLSDRPEYELSGSVLKIMFKTSDEFKNYVRRALTIVASRQVAFAVVEIQDKFVKCRALFNQTSPLECDDAIIDLILNAKK